MKMIKERDFSIDILKFMAAVLITNSHMDLLYGKYSILATGGAIGDVLFFFCSGFTLFNGRKVRFDNWYKRRINRVYPSIFAWAILSSFVFGISNDMKYTIMHGGGWFVSCIMIYYVILFFIQRFMLNKLQYAFLITTLICIAWYLLIDRPTDYNMYGYTFFKWCHYFLFMLLGASIGVHQKDMKFNEKKDLTGLLISIIVFYAVYFAAKTTSIGNDLQIISLIPLLGVTLYFYKLCNCNLLKKLYKSRYVGWVMNFTGGLCLEIYLVQSTLFTDKMNNIFPLNLVIMFIIILAVAYLLRCLARIFSQTFKDGEYDWNAVFKATL